MLDLRLVVRFGKGSVMARCGERHVKDDGSWWESDAKGIPLARVCDHCIKDRLSRFKPAVLTDNQREIVGADCDDDDYEGTVEEPIEPSEW